MTDNTTTLTDYLNSSAFEDLPSEVVHEAKRSILDTFGCMVAGLDTPLGDSLGRLAARFADQSGSLLLGRSGRVLPLYAAMAHGFTANAHDADDGHRGSRLHAGGVIIPAALALAEADRLSGRKLVEAVVVGFELGHRVGLASTVREEYYGSAHGGAFGAAAAAARLLNLEPEGVINALGMCEMHAPSCLLMGWVDARRVPMVKEGMGWGAASGLMAAWLAAEGVTGTQTVFTGLEDVADLDGLGRNHQILKRYYKPGPGCRWSHSPLQALQGLMAEHDLTPETVASITVRTFDKATSLDLIQPPTMEDAQYSIPFVLGATLAEGRFGPAQMTPDKLRDPAILAQAAKVSLVEAPEFNELYPGLLRCEVEVTAADGRVLSARSGRVKGDVDHPLSDEELTDKFIWMTENRLAADTAGKVADLIWSLDEATDVGKLMAELHRAVGV